MSVVSANAFWRLKHGFVQNFPTLRQENAQCDVLVIGGGIAGSLMSYELLKRGFDTILLEKYDVGSGSTSANTALVQYEIDQGLVELSKTIGTDAAVKAYQASMRSIEKIQRIAEEISFPYIQNRKSFYFAKNDHDAERLNDELIQRKIVDPTATYLNQKDIEKMFSFSRPGALMTERALELDPYLFTHRLIKESEERGLRVFDRTEFLSFVESEDGITAHIHPGHQIRAQHIVFTVGYEVGKFLPGHLFTMNSTFALVSKPIAQFTGWFEKSLLWEKATPYFYLRTTGDGRAIIGGLDEPISDPHKRDELITKKSHVLLETFQKMFPQIDFTPAYAWGGAFGETNDSLPYIGHLACSPRVHFSCGFGGNGTTFSALASDIICDSIQGKTNDLQNIFGFYRSSAAGLSQEPSNLI